MESERDRMEWQLRYALEAPSVADMKEIVWQALHGCYGASDVDAVRKRWGTWEQRMASCPSAGSLPHPSGIMANVVCTDPAAHLELIELCAKWHRKKRNSLYIDCEQSLSSYRAKPFC